MSKNKARQTLKLAPANGYLFLKPLDDEQTKGWKVAGVEEAPQRAKVLAVGGAMFHDSGELIGAPAKKGDIVVHSAFGFESIRHKGDQYLLCPFDKILAVILSCSKK